MTDPLALLRASFDAAVVAADPARVIGAALPPRPPGRVLVVGAGKAAASMAAAVEAVWPDVAGLVITRYGHACPTRRIGVVEAGHPVPDEAGVVAAAEILRRAGELGPGDLLLALISGGGSSLLALPAPSIPMADLKAVTHALLASGAPIEQINVLRKHLSCLAGGRLAAAAAARGAAVCALIISDVTGDSPSDIASGPCAADPSTYADALAVLARWGVAAPASVRQHLVCGARGGLSETIKPGNPLFAQVENRVIASAHQSLVAAAEVFRAAGVTPVILGDTVTGEAREVAKVYAALAREIHSYGAPFASPVALISGGECTVSLAPGQRGRGGRCSEFLLSLAVALEGEGVHAIACDTDGIDGSEDNAGAVLDPGSVARARAGGVEARTALDAHDAWGFFAASDGLIVTGPTRTNVNDYRAILLAGVAGNR
ncbi:MAG: glycerate kinase [Burkholderiaceae bacterium]